MPESTAELQQMEAAAERVAAKLRTFHDGLTPDERQAIELGLRRLVAQADERTGDAAGYAIPTGVLVRLAVELELYRMWAEGYESWRSQGAPRQ